MRFWFQAYAGCIVLRDFALVAIWLDIRHLLNVEEFCKVPMFVWRSVV